MKKLTITFDNGPDPACTPGVLDALREHNIKASFFVCGQGNTLHPAMKARHEEGMAILAAAKDEGHWIGNHSLTHTVELGTTDDIRVIAREIGDNEAILDGLNEHKLFRPYMGGGVVCKRTFSPPSVRYLQDHGYTTVLFNCVPGDWREPDRWPEIALETMDTLAWPLLIVHDVDRYGSMKQLPGFLASALEAGYEFVQEFPDDCVPIRKGKLCGNLEGMVCGDVPEPATRLSRLAVDSLT